MLLRLLAIFGFLAPYIVSFVAGSCAAYFWFHSWFFNAYQPGAPERSFEIKDGWNFGTIAEKLQEEGFVKNASSIYYLSRLRTKTQAAEHNIHVGEYRISAGMTPFELLDAIVDGKIVYHEVTIPEGTRMLEIPGLLTSTGLTTIEEVDQALRDRAFMSQLGVASSFEGALFPDTYKFTRPEDARAMIKRMVENGKQKFTKDMVDRSIDLGMTTQQILTLASVIEKETGKGEERPIISSVFHNRLRIGMPLQSDPTVIYGVANFDGNLTKEHLNSDTPYNTYLRTGLPPTPICSPGVDSIRAALYPADTDYIYFVGKGDGTHQFSATYKEHRNAVEIYQKSQKAHS